LAGVAWFGLLFFAGITSSLAMGTPCMGFLRDEFGWSREKSAWAFGLTVLILGAPTVLFYDHGVFGEYDYWAGTVSLVVFAMLEIILFAWIFGMDKGWAEITRGADIRVPHVFKFVIKYITPVILVAVFLGSLFSTGGIIDNLLNKQAYADLAAAVSINDTVKAAALEAKLFYINGSRLLLVLIFAAIAYMVYRADRNRVRISRA